MFVRIFFGMSAYSAPGKALLAGGFLVLDPQYCAYVTALSARMHAVVQRAPGSGAVRVLSPQFGGEWRCRRGAASGNPFVDATLATVWAYVGAAADNVDLTVTIYSDRGFHAANATAAHRSANGAKTFLFHRRAINEVAKTGLGSSAGLVTVLTAALMSQYRPVDLGRIHNLAQVAHCRAQRKVGSGFDVAAAVYGSIVYQRFEPHVVTQLLATERFDAALLRQVVDADWHFTATPAALPPGIKLVMGDIRGGLETPRLVSRVAAWRDANPQQSQQLYAALNAANQRFIAAVSHLHAVRDDPQYPEWVRLPLSAPVAALLRALGDVRAHLQQLTQLSGAEIEPPQQTARLDRCCQVSGVLGGVVPGAGGYDAICLLVLESCVPQLVATEDAVLEGVTWLDLSEEARGIRQEDPRDYEGIALES